MRFSDSFLEELRARLPVSEVVGSRVSLKKAGREWKGLSPFSKEKTPSFFVNDQKMAWFDFSSGKNGNIFDFLMMTEGLTFPEAVERLAQQAGMPLPKASQDDEVQDRKRRSLHEVLEAAAKFFQKNLAGREGAIARGYLSDRGITSATQLEFQMGFALPGRFALKEHLGSLGISVDVMIEAGLLIAGEDIPVPYDRFRDRVIIPIHDQRGRVVGFGGRTLRDDVQPKYLNSPESTIFQKGTLVFNFHRARQAAHENDSVVVVEGYMDAIAIYQAGLKAVVATMGTAFTEGQIANLWRLASEPVVCFDSDRAGVAAANRVVDRILPVLKVGRTFRFALLQGEKDPDDFIRERGIEEFRSQLAGSLPLWELLWEREVANAKIDTPDGQAALEQKLRLIIQTIQDPDVKKAYERTSRVQLAQFFWETGKKQNVSSEDWLPNEGFVKNNIKTKKTKRLPKKSSLKIAREGRQHGLQKVLLGLLVHYPELLDNKSDVIADIHFTPRLEEFRKGLVNLLILNDKLEVHVVYKHLKPGFFDVLQEIHGEKTDRREWGYKLFQVFPILKRDPHITFISDCIDHFAVCLRVEQIADEIDALQREIENGAVDAEVGAMHLIEMVRDLHLQREQSRNQDMALEEIAGTLRRVYSPNYNPGLTLKTEHLEAVL